VGAAATDRRAWSSSIAIGVAFTGLTVLYSLYLARYLIDYKGWADVSMLTDAGRYVWGGHVATVYHSSRYQYALPLSFFVMAPLQGLTDLAGWHPGANPHYVQLVGAYVTLFGIILLRAVRGLAWDLGVRSRLWVVQVVSLAIVMVPEFELGHLEDVLALAFTLFAVRRLLADDPVGAALLLSVAVSFKQWAVMLIPLFVLLSPAGRRLRTLLAACALPGALMLYFLSVDWSVASKAFFAPVTVVVGSTGHPWFDGTWLGSRSSQVNRMAAAVLAAGASWRLRRVRGAVAILAVTTGVLLIRPLTETVNFAYYWSPGLLMAVMVGCAAHRRVRWQDWLWPVLALIWALPQANDAAAWQWWAGELVLLGMTALQVARNCGSVRLPGERDQGGAPPTDRDHDAGDPIPELATRG
jgi:hypothetical protein